MRMCGLGYACMRSTRDGRGLDCLAMMGRWRRDMRIWLVLLAVGMLVLLGCGSSKDAVPPAPAPAPSLTPREAIGLVQTHLRKMCSPTSAYLKESHHFNAVRLKLVGQVAVQWQNSMEGQWFVLPEGGGIRTGTLVNEHCN